MPYGKDLIQDIPDLLNALCGANEDHPVSTYSVSVIMKINEKNISMVLLY